ncbi:MAG: class F sortase [Propionibacteriaceae bacterium]|jgi:hypothetical protein|nr:class F sortase [Propionibacteriaceae bacterium]
MSSQDDDQAFIAYPESDDNTSSQATETQEPPRKRSIIPLIVAIVLIVAGIGMGVYYFMGGSIGAPPAGSFKDMEGKAVLPEDPIATNSAFLQEAAMVADDGGDGFVIPSINLDVPLGSINEVNGVMNPPNFTNAFVIRNRGVDLAHAADGTVYAVTHAIQGGTAPGNKLQDHGNVTLTVGDTIKLNGVEYVYESSMQMLKGDIPNEASLWTDDPGRLIIITCVLNPKGGNADDNLILIAHLKS